MRRSGMLKCLSTKISRILLEMNFGVSAAEPQLLNLFHKRPRLSAALKGRVDSLKISAERLRVLRSNNYSSSLKQILGGRF